MYHLSSTHITETFWLACANVMAGIMIFYEVKPKQVSPLKLTECQPKKGVDLYLKQCWIQTLR